MRKKHGVKGFLESVAKKTGADKVQTVGGEGGKEDASLEEELRASLGF